MPHKKINKLTLLEREVNGKQAVWKCRCDCGREKKFSEELLFSGVIPSCGIKHCGQIHLPEGMKIGKLTTVRQTGGSGSASSLWLCRCDCGKERTVYQRYLLDGTVTSCGCERSGLYPGLRIGRLTLQSAFRDGERKKWLCRCDCGKEVAVFPSALHSGKTQSCGCFGLQAGDRFGKLVILRQMDSARCLCRCDCGKEKQIFRAVR
ncbi:MAG: hypothetical protein IJ088_12405 [Clostridia bacterium]|nr:hypothetical protein [Clostridia bacterium]